MKVNIYAVHDTKAEYFFNLIVDTQNIETDIIRGFNEALLNKQTKVGKYPAEHNLYKIGQLDTSTGKLESNGVLELVVSGKDTTEANNARPAEQS